MQGIIEKLKENMQVIYRKAVDADQALGQLHASGKGKFSEVFTEDAGFTVKSKRFQPYVEELAADILSLEQQINEQEAFSALLPCVVKKMERLLSTLSHFQASLKR